MRALVLCVVLASCTRWTTSDVILQGTVITTTAIDWHQTTSITRDCLELNTVIGRCGEAVPVSLYFPFVIAFELAAANALPRPWRGIFQAFVIGIEASTIYANYRNGH